MPRFRNFAVGWTEATPILELKGPCLGRAAGRRDWNWKVARSDRPAPVRHHALRAQMGIIDVTRVPVIDSTVAHELLNTVAVARLMGARVVMSGISTAHAEAMSCLGVTLTGLDKVMKLADAVALASVDPPVGAAS